MPNPRASGRCILDLSGKVVNAEDIQRRLLRALRKASAAGKEATCGRGGRAISPGVLEEEEVCSPSRSLILFISFTLLIWCVSSLTLTQDVISDNKECLCYNFLLNKTFPDNDGNGFYSREGSPDGNSIIIGVDSECNRV